MLFAGADPKVAVTVMSTERGSFLVYPIVREQVRSYNSIAILPPGA